MKIFNERENKWTEIKFKGTLKTLFKKLKINSGDYLAVCNGEVITQDQKLSNTDEIKLLSVVSGG